MWNPSEEYASSNGIENPLPLEDSVPEETDIQLNETIFVNISGIPGDEEEFLSTSSNANMPTITKPSKNSKKRTVMKRKRNSGKEYETYTKNKTIRSERQMKTTCGKLCRWKCSTRFSEVERKQLFSKYWGLGDLELQRQYIVNCMKEIEAKDRNYRPSYVRRKLNSAYFFERGKEKIRVCKSFFQNTLDITTRTVRTVREKQHKAANNVILEPDQRGKHGKHKALDPKIKAGVEKFLDTIPIIQFKCTGTNISKTVIHGNKSIRSIHKDYVDMCQAKTEAFANYTYFYRTFKAYFGILEPKEDASTSYNSKPQLNDPLLLHNCVIEEINIDDASFDQLSRSCDISREEEHPKNLSNTLLIPTLECEKRRKTESKPTNPKRIVMTTKSKGEEINKTMRSEKQIKSTCVHNCKYKCYKNFSQTERKQLMSEYWGLGDLQSQRQYIAKWTKPIEPKYRHVRALGSRTPRKHNRAYFFERGKDKIRVCRIFFENTLDISNRIARTVIKKQNKIANKIILEPDQRGKHEDHKAVERKIKAGIKKFIGTIPKMEAQYYVTNIDCLDCLSS